jgi:rare lipoprotein A (peptidoglycan hydrolase)
MSRGFRRSVFAHVVVGAQAERRWNVATASAYSPSDSPGNLACTGRPLTWSSPTVAHRHLPCGTRLRICTRPGVCVTAPVADRGPFVAGRTLDLAPGVYRALGARTALGWGVRTVRWTVEP